VRNRQEERTKADYRHTKLNVHLNRIKPVNEPIT